MRTVKGIYKAIYEPIGDLVTYRAMPTQQAPMEMIEPFIFLNHHGWQNYPPHNHGLPFGPHPHRGFETVTFILEGDLTHKDSGGGESIINAGGIQWMTAGSGLIHAEISSEEFKQKGGPLEILQLWLNLPAKYKMTKPAYKGLQKDQIPTVQWDNGKVTAHIVSGKWNEVEAAFQPLTDVSLAYVNFQSGGKMEINIPRDQNIFFYVVKGEVDVNGQKIQMHHLVDFEHDAEKLNIDAITDATILLGYATPFKEPIVAYGPFVMNTREEIMQAYEDYRQGKFGDEHNF